jgi:hypothetical protein
MTSVISDIIFLLDVHSREHHGIKADISHQSSISCACSECIHLPTDSWDNAEFTLEEPLPNHEIVKNVIISSNSFVWSAPAATYKIKLTIFNNNSDIGLHFWGLSFPPHLEILNFCECKSSIGIGNQLLDGRVKDVSDTSDVDAPFILSSVEVFNCAQPSFISMRMWNEMHHLLGHIELLLLDIGEIFQLSLGFDEILFILFLLST